VGLREFNYWNIRFKLARLVPKSFLKVVYPVNHSASRLQ
jgi:hypothetical protein